MSGMNDSQDLSIERVNNIVYQCAFCATNLEECAHPKLLSCLHGACPACISAHEFKEKDGTTSVKCKVCMQAENINRIIENVFVIERKAEFSKEMNKSRVCIFCEDAPLASSFCYTCQDWLCEICVQMHARVKMTNNHLIKSKEEMKGNSITNLGYEFSMCSNHIPEELKLYCTTCEKLTCRDCQLVDHKGHDYTFLTNAYIEKNKTFCQNMPKMEQKNDKIIHTFKQSEQRLQEVRKQRMLAANEIKNLETKLISKIKKMSAILLEQLDDMCLEETTKLQKNMDTLVHFSECLQHCLTITKMSIESSCELSLVYAANTINFNTKKLLNQRYQKCRNKGKYTVNYNENECDQMIRQMRQISISAIDSRDNFQSNQGDELPSTSNEVYSLPLSPQEIEMEHSNGSDTVSSYIHDPQQHYDQEVAEFSQSPLDRSSNASQAYQQHSNQGASKITQNLSIKSSNGNQDYQQHFSQGRVIQNPQRYPSGNSIDYQGQQKNSVQGATHLSQNNTMISLKRQTISMTPVNSMQSQKQSASHGILSHTPVGLTQAQIHVDTTIAPSVNPIFDQLSDYSCEENLDTSSNSITNVVEIENSEYSSSTSSETRIMRFDSNEYYCSMCKNGGRLILCHNCPRLYHEECHIPQIPPDANSKWNCIMCEDFKNCSLPDQKCGMKRTNGLNDLEFLRCQRIIAEIFCVDKSDSFISACSKMERNKFKTISNPMTLHFIKKKLDKTNPNFYQTVDEFLADLDLYFQNCQNMEEPLVQSESLKFNDFYIHLKNFFWPGSESSTANSDPVPSAKKTKISNE